ncbi:MAG: glycogen/starch/alpha-glucan phosphorylase [Deltaproteobacteria bacterium]|jgi:starch phosphorylase|nr:glycogen/starch/alpha-glucan phosphorylase [Deltaproteobacteria bacterium]MBW2535325.1 glycogen/starch/alpha-glucan phosphorylase [Deltaproteobacteria bacterium]
MAMNDHVESIESTEIHVEDDRTGMQPATLRRAFVDHVQYSRARILGRSTALDRYVALALSLRDRLVHRWEATEQTYDEQDVKRVYYLSAEFLLGRMLRSNLDALDVLQSYRTVLANLGMDLDELIEHEPEPGLGNGGLGRLAACFLDSMATLGYPGGGYGIRYEFGIFEQAIRDGQQVELPDELLRFDNPWEIERPEDAVEVCFGGRTQAVPTYDDGYRMVWKPDHRVLGVPHDTPIAGYRNDTVNTLRLWAARSGREFDFRMFNAGDYVRAVEGKNASEVISKVLYPNDNFEKGRELRLKQEYFFVSCSVQDIVRKHLRIYGNLDRLSDKVAIQLNDTHPALTVAELMRLLVDEHGMPWTTAWRHTVGVVSFTNHTLLPEALETWPLELIERLLPRHAELIGEIDRRFVREVRTAYPRDPERCQRMAIVDEQSKTIRMAHLAVVGSHSVNGVAELHTDLLQRCLMRDFHDLYPSRFSNKTNGVTPRRWLLGCNPELFRFISECLGDEAWITDLERLAELEPHCEQASFQERLLSIKRAHQQSLAKTIADDLGVEVDPTYIFDVQIKRLHEYKRQLLNLLHIVSLYLKAKRGDEVAPRLFIFGAKAAPGYRTAKLIIQLIHDVADVVNGDPRVSNVRLAFLPNYRVTLAERIIPAADVSEQISTAGMEASGTGNMKLSMNGALTIGTLDGANIEIRDAVGHDNFFLFGMTADEVAAKRRAAPAGRAAYEASEALREVVDLISEGFFNHDEPGRYRKLMTSLLEDDFYQVLGDFDAYAACQERLAQTYQNRMSWARMAGLNIARIGRFSSDRTIQQYAQEIWGVRPVKIALPPSP